MLNIKENIHISSNYISIIFNDINEENLKFNNIIILKYYP